MKKFVVLLSVLLFNSILFSAPVSIETAERVAENWYFERGRFGRDEFTITNYFVEPSPKGDSLFYIFNFVPNGFIIVSADDIIIPVLGYTFTYQYSLENHPPQFDAWVSSYKEQIIYAKENALKAVIETIKAWNRLNVKSEDFVREEDIKSLSPMLTTTWNQINPYNSQCPTVSGHHCVVGCVGVAMAQVMKYYNYPSQGTGSHSYSDECCGQTVSANFSTTYAWSNMPNSLIGANSTQINATAKLLFHCGVSVNMCYGVSGSGADIGSLCEALKTYFYYDSDVRLVYKSDYSSSTWESMMRTELNNSRPIAYAGTGGQGGHAFNMDGYQGTNYFHFNWGWEGAYDGYFYLNDLTPGSYNFTNNQQAVINISPNSAPPAPSNCQASDDYCNCVVVSWTTVSGAAFYKIYRDGSYISNDNTPSYIDEITGTHSYKVTAVNSCGESGFSPSDDGTGLTVPSSPTSCGASDNYTDKIVITWQDNSNDEAGFEVYRNDSYIDSVGVNQTSYTDRPSPGIYSYYVTAYNNCGESSPSNSDNGTCAVEEEIKVVPKSFYLAQNSPNPVYNCMTSIPFGVPKEAQIVIRVYDASGKKVRTLIVGVVPAGHHIVIWDIKNDEGKRVVPGIYFYRLEVPTNRDFASSTGEFKATKKLTILK